MADDKCKENIRTKVKSNATGFDYESKTNFKRRNLLWKMCNKSRVSISRIFHSDDSNNRTR